MDTCLKVELFQNSSSIYADEFSEPVELGRQQNRNEPVYTRQKDDSGWRVAIARIEDVFVPRRYVRIEPLANNRVRVVNLSAKHTIQSDRGVEVPPNEAGEFLTPSVLTLGERYLRIEPLEPPAPDEFQSLPRESAAPAYLPAGASLVLPKATLSKIGDEGGESLLEWLQAVTQVLQSAASSDDFFQRAANAIVELVRLDSGAVVLREGKVWNVVAKKTALLGLSPTQAAEWEPSRRILDSVLQQRRTLWKVPDMNLQSEGSLAQLLAVVAAPILNQQGEVIGALYGDRRVGSMSNRGLPNISKLEAMLVGTLASGVAAGLARMEKERAAVAAQVKFEQFFTPELSRQMAAEPDLLRGRNAEVTLMFCDIRGFSRVSERMGPAKTVEWVGAAMCTLSDCVSRHQGVLVDYIGDALFAMWGAPVPQADHAQLACLAALDMLRAMPDFNAQWQPQIQETTTVGIGINSGIAHVGNTGSDRKFKYGPLGNAVNLASRVEGATKYLKTSLLITAATRGQLDASFSARRICKVRVVNIVEPVDLYELVPEKTARWEALREAYEHALAEFEMKNFREAASILGILVTQHPNDFPSLVLLERSVNELVSPSADFKPEWVLSGK